MIRRNHKDRLFVRLFGNPENKENLLSLYNALNDRNYTDPDELEINTIDDVIYMGRKNDVSCIIDAHMNLFEHQSTYNPNMPLRGFIYIAKLYEKYIEEYGLNINSGKLVKIPTPRYFVLYNGIEDMPEVKELKLSDAFTHPDENFGIEFTATMVNINYGKNKKLMEACRVLEEYSIFVAKVREYVKLSMDENKIEKAIDRVIDECINEGVLSKFLSAHKAEVKGMILTEYDEEKTMEMFKREFRQEGEKNGIEITKKNIAARLREKGMSDDDIADTLSVTPEQLKEMLDQSAGTE